MGSALVLSNSGVSLTTAATITTGRFQAALPARDGSQHLRALSALHA